MCHRTHGAAVVSSRICLFLRSCASGRCCKCFSRELRRSIGEMGAVSTAGVAWSAIVVASFGSRAKEMGNVDSEVAESSYRVSRQVI